MSLLWGHLSRFLHHRWLRSSCFVSFLLSYIVRRRNGSNSSKVPLDTYHRSTEHCSTRPAVMAIMKNRISYVPVIVHDSKTACSKTWSTHRWKTEARCKYIHKRTKQTIAASVAKLAFVVNDDYESQLHGETVTWFCSEHMYNLF